MKYWIRKNLPGKKVLYFFAISSAIYLVMLFITIPKVMAFAGGMKILDMMPTGYNREYVLALMEALGETGRNIYLYYQIPADLLYPFFFAASNCLILSWFLNKLRRLETRLWLICYLPVLGGVFDYSENFSIIGILVNYPAIQDNLIFMANVFTILKSIFVTFSLTAILILVVWWIVSKFLKLPNRKFG